MFCKVLLVIPKWINHVPSSGLQRGEHNLNKHDSRQKNSATTEVQGDRREIVYKIGVIRKVFGVELKQLACDPFLSQLSWKCFQKKKECIDSV